MVRPRGRGFCYSLEEYQTMILDTKLFWNMEWERTVKTATEGIWK
jgi:copper homeostasis protein CutC